MTIFIKSGHDKLTAVGASFGGLFLGYLGQTFSVYTNMNLTNNSSVTFLFENLGVKPIDMIGTKFVIFFIAYILFNVFAILHMKKTKKVDVEENADLYAQELGLVPAENATTAYYTPVSTREEITYNVSENWFDDLCEWVSSIFGG